MSMNLNPDRDLVSESELRAALRPNKIDADSFEAGVRQRIQAAEAQRANDPLADAPPLLRVAAAVMPVPVITGGKVTASAAPLAHVPGLSKLLGYVAMPAVSLFVMVGAFVFGAARIRNIQRNNLPDSMDQLAMEEAARLWWHQNKRFARVFFAATIVLPILGATALLLLLYSISLGMMLYMLSGLAKLGLGNRRMIAGSCVAGLGLLGVASLTSTIGQHDIHFVDQMLLPAIFLGGVLILIPFLGPYGTIRGPFSDEQQPRWLRALLLVLMIAWLTHAIWWPITPTRIKARVESFDRAPYSSVSWQNWEIVASWAIESGLDPDLSAARRLLAAEISGEKNPFVLGSAFRVGLVRVDQMGPLADPVGGYEDNRHLHLDYPHHFMATQPILSLNQQDWVIRAKVLRNDLTAEERDVLAKQLHVNLEKMSADPYRQLEEALRVTQLLEVIGRPIDRGRYRSQIHDFLRESHVAGFGFFREPGGFKKYPNSIAGDLQATAYAVELMQIYGVPDGIDVNWVRSFLRPRCLRFGDDSYMAAAALARLNSLPGVSPPTWLDYVYYERSLIMAALLVALCIYATLSSPLPRSDDTVDGSSQSGRTDIAHEPPG